MLGRALVLLLLALMPLTLGCQKPPEADVVCTTSLIADITQRIVGDKLTVVSLMGPGVDPHRYSPSPGDIQKLSSAKVVFYNGFHLEGKMVDVLEQSQQWKALAVTRNLKNDPRLRRDPLAPEVIDPHVWFSVPLWIICTATIADDLIAHYPEHAETFRDNADALIEEFKELHAYLHRQAKLLPREERILVTSHDAFGYFGDEYGFTVRGLQGVSTAAETSTVEIDSLVKFIAKRTKPVPAIFTETSVPTQGLDQVLDEVRKQYQHEVKLIGGEEALYSDALGDPNGPAGTYTGMMKHNMTVVMQALK
jgi:manganese/zinc/iron transport system substrate-binding protein